MTAQHYEGLTSKHYVMKVTKKSAVKKAVAVATVKAPKSAQVKAKAETITSDNVLPIMPTAWAVKHVFALVAAGVNPTAWGMLKISDTACSAANAKGKQWLATWSKEKASAKKGFLVLDGKHFQVLAGLRKAGSDVASVTETIYGTALEGVASIANAKLAREGQSVAWCDTAEQVKKIVGNARTVFAHCTGGIDFPNNQLRKS
jgi:hypothetical protein